VDSLILNKTIPPVLVIKPNGAYRGSVPPTGSLWANSELNGNFEDFFLKEVIPWTESRFRVKTQRQYRLLMGHSFGASGAVRLTLQNLDLFGSVASHSGFVKFDDWLCQVYVNNSLRENNFTANITFPNPSLYSNFVYTGARAWSPNASAPFGVDLPMINDGTGTLDMSIVNKWTAFSPHIVIADTLANLTAKPLGLFYLDIGRNDELLLLQPNLDFSGQLFNIRVKNSMSIYDGPHNNPVLLRLRFATSITSWSEYLATLESPTAEVITISNDSKTNRTLVIALSVTGSVVGAILIVSLIIFIAIRKKWHILLLEKNIAKDESI